MSQSLLQHTVPDTGEVPCSRYSMLTPFERYCSDGAGTFLPPTLFVRLGESNKEPSDHTGECRDLMVNLTPSWPEKKGMVNGCRAGPLIKELGSTIKKVSSDRLSENEALRTQLAFAKREKTDAIKKLLPTVVGRLLQSHEYKQSLSVPFNYALQLDMGQGLAERGPKGAS
ncbi:hypothetical protein Tco_1525049 [Tanacetum coccineum]